MAIFSRTLYFSSLTSLSRTTSTLFTILLFLAVSILSLSPSASAEPINITLNGEAIDSGRTYTKFAAKDKSLDLVCTAKAANAKMSWLRTEAKKEQDMDTVCNASEEPKENDSKSRPPAHCILTLSQETQNNVPVSVLRLSFYRLRKEPNITRNLSTDFRKYTCTAQSEGNQDGSATLELLETVSANRNFDKGHTSVTVVQGDKLEIYCNIHGVTKEEISSGIIKVSWQKDGKDLETTNKNGISDILDEKPLRAGFRYEMAEPENRGTYKCIIKGKDALEKKNPEFSFYVRVKDKMGALWPFLAICGEVVILCTIILIYEQRRNKAELEESDTDGSPDQKNSNDDGD